MALKGAREKKTPDIRQNRREAAADFLLELWEPEDSIATSLKDVFKYLEQKNK